MGFRDYIENTLNEVDSQTIDGSATTEHLKRARKKSGKEYFDSINNFRRKLDDFLIEQQAILIDDVTNVYDHFHIEQSRIIRAIREKDLNELLNILKTHRIDADNMRRTGLKLVKSNHK